MFTMQIFHRNGDDYDTENLEGTWYTANDAYQAFEQRHSESTPCYKGIQYLELLHNGKRIFSSPFATLNKGALLVALENCGAMTSEFGKFFNRMLEVQNVT